MKIPSISIEDFYTLTIHEVGVVEDGNLVTTVIRVPGGWIYRSYDKSHGILASVFVPFNNEFMK